MFIASDVFFFILALMASNDEFLVHKGWRIFRANMLCVCQYILTVLLSSNTETCTLWLGNYTYTWLAELFGAAPNDREVKKGKCTHSLSVSMCPCLSDAVCVLMLSVGACLLVLLWQVAVLLLDSRLKTASSLSWGCSLTSFACLLCSKTSRYICNYFLLYALAFEPRHINGYLGDLLPFCATAWKNQH